MEGLPDTFASSGGVSLYLDQVWHPSDVLWKKQEEFGGPGIGVLISRCSEKVKNNKACLYTYESASMESHLIEIVFSFSGIQIEGNELNYCWEY